ncbi:Phage-related baseplate assembly protein [Planctomycetes bacterium Pan216]|uniref:Phage-related baseplate assembly protein n=1 Tax=Kolteria novifilia TaxID=2527975 RepID=A0A518B2W2_9BACT|nr:Phage-related baseplate assembly protein [Planctomycetes bacterium Pan216]
MRSDSLNPRSLRLNTSLPDGVLSVRRLRGQEAIGDLYRFEIDLVARPETSVSPETLLGKSATLVIQLPDQPVRRINGIIGEFTQGQTGELYTSYRAVLVPRFWLLTKDRRTRAFQQMSVTDIAIKVLRDAGVEVEVHDLGTYVAQNFCVQYRESTFNFVQRILQESGLYYNWTHTEDAHRLIILDRTENTYAVAGQTWRFLPIAGGTRATGTISRWELRQELTAGEFQVRDLAFQLREQLVDAATPLIEKIEWASTTQALLGDANRKIAMVEHGPEFAQWFDDVGPSGEDSSADLGDLYGEGQKVVRRFMERHVAQGLGITGASDIAAIEAGKVLSTSNTPGGSGTFLVREVTHEAVQPVPWATAGEDSEPFSYQNTFDVLPTSSPYRPALTATKPKAGPEPAVVVGPREGHPHVDKHGRVRVAFSWSDDEQTNLSCWLRVGHAWAGKQRGHVHLPRVGDEVIVNFYQQDPDRPFVDHSVHNAESLHPRDLPDNNQQSVFRSAGLSDSSDFTGIAMDDLASHLQFFSSNDMSRTHGSNFYENVGGGKQSNIAGNRSSYLGPSIYKPMAPNVGSSSSSGSTSSKDKLAALHQRMMEQARSQSVSTGSSSKRGSSATSDANTSGDSGSGGVGGPAAWSASGDSTFDEISSEGDLTFGIFEMGAVGVNDTLILGTVNYPTINPIGLSFMSGIVSVEGAAIAGTLSGIWGNLAAVEVMGVPIATLGAYTRATYGPTSIIGHGPSVFSCPGSGAVYEATSALSVATAIFALLSFALDILKRFFNYWMDHKDGGTYSESRLEKVVLFQLAVMECQSIWFQLELLNYYLQDATQEFAVLSTTLLGWISTLFTFPALSWAIVETQFAAFFTAGFTRVIIVLIKSLIFLGIIIGILFATGTI